MVMEKYNRYKKQYQKDEQTKRSFDRQYKRSLQDFPFDKSQNESLCNIFTRYLDEKKNEKMQLFYKCEQKNKIIFLRNKKLNFNVEPRSYFCSVLFCCVLFCTVLFTYLTIGKPSVKNEPEL